MEEAREIDNRIYFEDALLTWNIMPILKRRHNLTVERSYRHVRVAQYEVDAITVCSTLEGIERWVGYELKESALEKAIQQAQLRRKYFDYFYVIANLKVSTIVDYIMKMAMNGIDLNGIGFISSEHYTTLVYPSRFKSRERMQLKNGREIPENQLSLLKFIRSESHDI